MTPLDSQIDEVISFISRTRERISTVVVGQDEVVERLLIALFTGGHLLLQGLQDWRKHFSFPRCRSPLI